MIESIPIFQWALLALSGILFIGPGVLVLSFIEEAKRYDIWEWGIVSFCVSSSVLSILFAWLQPTGITLGRWSLFLMFLLAWIIAIGRIITHGKQQPIISKDSIRFTLLIGISSLAVIAVGLYGIRHTVAGLGSDSYHHTLITQLIVDNGRIPDDLLSVSPIATFTYHFGFHAISTFLSWMTEIEPRLIIPVLGRILIALSGFSTAFFTNQVIQSRKAGLIAFIVTTVILVFPNYMLNWGRYTQLAGMVLFAVFLGLLFNWGRVFFNRFAHLLVIIAAGIVLTHYRIALMAIIASIILFLYIWIPGFRSNQFRQNLSIVFSSLGVLVLCLPWIIHVIISLDNGYAVNRDPLGLSYHSFSRLGLPVINHPLNPLILIIAGVSSFIGWKSKDQLIIWLSTWMVSLLALSDPIIAGEVIDRISVIISFSLPISVFVSWGCINFIRKSRFSYVMQYLLFIAFVPLLAIGFHQMILNISIEEGQYVHFEDLRATEWIRQNTMSDAKFIVNTMNFDFQPKHIIGTDAGYWLKLLADRTTVTMPMIYIGERLRDECFLENLIFLNELNGNLISIEAIDFQRKNDIDYVFIGKKGGNISPSTLEASEYYERIYADNDVYIFRFLPNP